MVREILSGLQVKPGGTYMDCTAGEGGHCLAISKAAPQARLIGIDLDPAALEVARLRLEGHEGRVTLVNGNFAELDEIARENGLIKVDGVLFDLGVSSLQLGSGHRGFSFSRSARLDMRFDPTQWVTAHRIVNEASEESLADTIRTLGEQPGARRVARAIVRDRPIETTTQLADLVERVLDGRGATRRGRVHPATRTFQALRMTVNQEMGNLDTGLEKALKLLAIGGRIAILSYHSVEDRLVKNILRRESAACICPPSTPECVCDHTPSIRLVNRRVIKPQSTEVQANPRSRSARLRVAERI